MCAHRIIFAYLAHSNTCEYTADMLTHMRLRTLCSLATHTHRHNHILISKLFLFNFLLHTRTPYQW